MAYTVKKLAEISGVSVRTLHFYDEIDLLKPAYLGANGYRYYEEEQLLMLQQILFFRELGFELRQIESILSQNNFNKVKALKAHRHVLLQQAEQTEQLIKTIDKTIEKLTGGKKMKAKEMFAGFDPKKQAEHEQYLIKRFGEDARTGIEQSKRKVQNWTKTDWEQSRSEWDAICKELVRMMKDGATSESAQVQRTIQRHYEWLKRFWTPTKESYGGHGQFILDTELAAAYNAYHPELAGFMSNAIQVFADRELS
jgi:MerR family transcriptional regulator, thiopeptide resistance regulator